VAILEIAMTRTAPSKLAKSRLSIEDGLALGLATLFSFMCIRSGWFDRICMMLRRDEQYELDEYVGTSFIFLAVAVAMFIRREWQLRARLTASSAREQHAHEAARKDHLTGLANRLALMERMNEVEGHDIVFLLIDLDGFKAINDRHGHASGDAVLTEVSARLKAIADSVHGRFVARLGGDEFGCLLLTSSAAEEVRVTREIISRIEKPIHLASGEVSVGASIGSAASVGGQLNPDELLHLSDIAMYDEKTRRAATGRASARQIRPVRPITDNSSVTAVYRKYRALEILREGLKQAFPPSQNDGFEDLLDQLDNVGATTSKR
jgi:diguanylate cyclase (GGDEF)-like protein